jgi:hypothetical protein
LSLQTIISDLFSKPKIEGANMALSGTVIENLTSYLLTAVVNEISAHSARIAAMNLQADITPAALDAANQKLLSLLGVLAPFESFLVAKYPELAPVVSLAQNYSNALKE